MDNRHIIIFDGVCNFCNSAVNFIIKRDSLGVFAFTPMQSEFAVALAKKHRIDITKMNTFVLIKNGQPYVRSDAALEVCKDLSGFWSFFYNVKIIPVFMRDFFYKLIAKNRYALFGKKNSCMIPDEKLKSRFVGI